jgi:hypothetical protein
MILTSPYLDIVSGVNLNHTISGDAKYMTGAPLLILIVGIAEKKFQGLWYAAQRQVGDVKANDAESVVDWYSLPEPADIYGYESGPRLSAQELRNDIILDHRSGSSSLT